MAVGWKRPSRGRTKGDEEAKGGVGKPVNSWTMARKFDVSVVSTVVGGFRDALDRFLDPPPRGAGGCTGTVFEGTKDVVGGCGCGRKLAVRSAASVRAGGVRLLGFEEGGKGLRKVEKGSKGVEFGGCGGGGRGGGKVKKEEMYS